jgi:hypothetical protein
MGMNCQTGRASIPIFVNEDRLLISGAVVGERQDFEGELSRTRPAAKTQSRFSLRSRAKALRRAIQTECLNEHGPIFGIGGREMPGCDLSVQRLRELALVDRPEIRRAQLMLVAASAKLRLAKRTWVPYPSVSVQAQHYNAG